ncbi:MAG: response regulator receiver protein [Geobacteraceae bacterium]|nr:response regulator receiver protein [Geobacteraceae bacterium]
MENRKLLGEILKERGIITDKTLQRALGRAKRFNKRLGAILEETELITGDELASALASQYGYRVVVNFATHSFPRELLSLIPADVAMENMLFPLKIEGDRLALAMADPTNTRIASNIAANNGLKVVPFISTRKDIIAAISRHYLNKDISTPLGKTVLVVEADNHACTSLGNCLSKEGYRVITATDGMEAYKTAISETPQVILVDKTIPKLDGYGLFDALKTLSETRLIPVILMTDNTDPEDEARAFEKGFFDFLTKPVKDVTLKTRVKRAFQYFEREYGLM